MHLLYLLFLSLSIFSSESLGFSPLAHREEMTIATQFQQNFNNYVKLGKANLLVSMMGKMFVFEDCRGRRMNRDEYAQTAIHMSIPGHIVSARADKNHIIYKVRFEKQTQEVMITYKGQKWKMTRAQALIC